MDKTETIFNQLLEVEDADQRRELAQRACGADRALLAKVQKLLHLHEDAERRFPSEPGGRGAETLPTRLTGDTALTEGPGTRIGRYKLLEKLGQGGFGDVWAAEQREPVRRRVALKIIKLGMDTKQVVARFEAERQALALMDHPNIAKVLDAGATEAGRPYFVMELVRGITITKYCDQAKLEPSDRLDLFISVCHAIQHAHQKGIIHRDIKPSNVLVTLHDGVPVPKVIDFGIAKATQLELTNKTIYTQFSQFIGTPAYMSPEQAEISGLDVDTRSDIYSLGVLLYELLTGATPFDTKELMQSGLDEMRKIIREREPIRPSTRLSQPLSAGKESRQTDQPPANRRSPIDRDLDWIVMKCLEKDRTRRYDTANGLAMDLKRHLHHEPIVARPPSAAYQLQKAWRRNRFAFTAATAVFLALLVGGAASTWQAIVAGKARTSETQARIRAERSGREAIAHGLRAEQQKEKAEAATRRAEQQERKIRLRTYAADMNLANQAVQMNHLGRAWALLNRYRPEAGEKDLRGWEWRYLWGRCQSDALFELGRLPGFEGAVSVAIRPAGDWVAIGGRRSTGVEVWDLAGRRRLAQLAAGETFSHVAFSPSGETLAFTAGQSLRLWNCATRKVTAEAAIKDPQSVAVAFSQDGQIILTFTQNGAITRWRASDLEELDSYLVPEGHAHLGTPFAVTGDLRTAVHVEGWDSIVIVDLQTGRELWRTNSTAASAHAMAISPDQERLVTNFGPSDGTIQVWDLRTGAQLGQLEGHRAWVSTLLFWPDGKTLASASADQTIRIWDMDRLEPIRTLRGHKLEIWSLALSSDAQTLVSGGKDGSILVWDATQDPLEQSAWSLSGLHSGSWQFTSDHQAIHSVEADSRRFIHFSGPIEPRRLIHHSGPTFQNAEPIPEILIDGAWIFSESGRLLAVGQTNGLLRLWDLDARKLVREFSTGTGECQPVAFSPGETEIWVAEGFERKNETRKLTQWSLEKQQLLRTAPPIRWPFRLHPDNWLFWEEEQGSFAFHDLKSGKSSRPTLTTGRWSDLAGRKIGASPDGKRLVLMHDLGVLTVWETASFTPPASPRQLGAVGGILMSFSNAEFSLDASRLLGASHGGEAIKIWETDQYQNLLTLDAEGHFFSDIRFSPDGTILGARSGTGVLHLWRAPSWQEIEAAEQMPTNRPSLSSGPKASIHRSFP